MALAHSTVLDLQHHAAQKRPKCRRLRCSAAAENGRASQDLARRTVLSLPMIPPLLGYLLVRRGLKFRR